MSLMPGILLLHQLATGMCLDGTIGGCTIDGCSEAVRECFDGHWGPCSCEDPLPLQTGVITGTLRFYQNQGNYCPVGRDCTGARYLANEFHTYQPLRDSTVYLVDAATGEPLGQAPTDASGNFIMAWTKQTDQTTVTGILRWTGQHKDGRFAIKIADGSAYSISSGSWSLTAGTTAQAPQALGSPFQIGQPALPNPYANIYDGAWRAWDVLKSSNRMMTHFTNVSVRFQSSYCASGCYIVVENTIHLPSQAEYMPQSRIVHEMGHAASYFADLRQACEDVYWNHAFCYPASSGDCGWTATTPEWSCVAFEEGLASFLADAALYAQSSPQPMTCVDSSACENTAHNVELSPSCVTDQNRWPLTVERFLRDVYDSNTDYLNETQDRSLFEFIDALSVSAPGTGEGQRDEPFNSARNSIDDLDGRSAVDFKALWLVRGVDTGVAFTNNCSPAGD